MSTRSFCEMRKRMLFIAAGEEILHNDCSISKMRNTGTNKTKI